MANHAGAFRHNRRECLFVWGDIVHPHRFLRANFAVEIAYSIGSYRGIFPQSGIANLIVLHEISENLVSTGRRSRGLERLWKYDLFPALVGLSRCGNSAGYDPSHQESSQEAYSCRAKDLHCCDLSVRHAGARPP